MWGALLGAAGAAAGFFQNERARSQARQYQEAMMREAMLARQQMQPLINRQLLAYDTVRGIVDKAKAQGQFDPAWMIKQLDQDYDRNLDQQTGAMSASLRNMGYRPGDSEVGVRMDSVIGKAMIDRDRQATDLRRGLFQDQLAAYNAIPSASLNSAAAMMAQGSDRLIGLNGQFANFYGSQIQNPANFLASIMPFLQQKQNSSGTDKGNNGSNKDEGYYNPDGPQAGGGTTPTPTQTSSKGFSYEPLFPYFNPYQDLQRNA